MPGETLNVLVNDQGTVKTGDFQGFNAATGDFVGDAWAVNAYDNVATVVWKNDTDAPVTVNMQASADTDGDVGSLNGDYIVY